MRFRGFFKRNLLETLRDPITLALGLGLPIFLLVLFSAINKAIEVPIPNFEIGELAPGVAVFSFSMLMMSEANLIAQDRNTALFARLKTLPLVTSDFMLAYALPFVFIGIGQYVLTFVVAFCFGLKWSPHVFTGVLVLMPILVIFILIGLMMGLSLNQNQTVGIGNGIIIVIAMLSGAWMPIALMGGFIEKLANALPFYNGVTALRSLLSGAPFEFTRLYVMLGYLVGFAVLGITVSAYKLKTK